MFFKKFPKVYYPFPDKTNRDSFIRVVSDITKNLRIYKKTLDKSVLFDEYDILDGETPELISERIYGTPYYHWLIMISNDLYDNINDFPLSDLELTEYLNEKYDNIWGLHHYEFNDEIVQPYETINFQTALVENPEFSITSLNVINTHLNAGKEVFMIAMNGYTVDTTYISIDTINYDTSNVQGTNINAPFIKITSYDINTTIASTIILSGDNKPGFIYSLFYKENESTGLVPFLSFEIKENSFDIPDIYTYVTNYEYEIKQNEKKRRIKVLSPNFIPTVRKEFNEIMKGF